MTEVYILKTLIFKLLLIFTSALLFIRCSDNPSASNSDRQAKSNDILVDGLATDKTIALFTNLQNFTADKVLFGHQETTAYGVGWINDGFGNKSDVKDVCGDFPAVYGWDIGDIGQATNVD